LVSKIDESWFKAIFLSIENVWDLNYQRISVDTLFIKQKASSLGL